jgi:hypothetical protein
MWIGFDWISIFIETQRNNDRDVCIGHQHDAWRTRDPDEAAKGYRVVAGRCSVDVRITPKGRAGGDGIKFAYELRQRGIDVSFDPLDELVERTHAHEIAWADDCFAITRWPLPDWSKLPMPRRT